MNKRAFPEERFEDASFSGLLYSSPRNVCAAPWNIGVVAIMIQLRALEAIRFVDPHPIGAPGSVARPTSL